MGLWGGVGALMASTKPLASVLLPIQANGITSFKTPTQKVLWLYHQGRPALSLAKKKKKQTMTCIWLEHIPGHPVKPEEGISQEQILLLTLVLTAWGGVGGGHAPSVSQANIYLFRPSDATSAFLDFFANSGSDSHTFPPSKGASHKGGSRRSREEASEYRRLSKSLWKENQALLSSQFSLWRRPVASVNHM